MAIKSGVPAAVATLALMLGVATQDASGRGADQAREPTPSTRDDPPSQPEQPDPGPQGELTLAFVGDIHFEAQLRALLDDPDTGLGAISGALGEADVTMANLESAITERGRRTPKELEVASERYHFRSSPAALDLLAAAGVDVVSVANNHGVDFGAVGLRDTLAARRTGPIPVLGVGVDRADAFAPYRVSIRGTDVAFIAADDSPREGSSPLWEADPDSPGLAAAHSDAGRALVAAVRAAAAVDHVVVVYLHWGVEFQGCPTPRQRSLARRLAAAGADVIVGTHTHVLLGSGWLTSPNGNSAYVNYGLGNFLWYHDAVPDSGILRLRIVDGAVVGETWVPARIRPGGRPVELTGKARADAVADWRRLRGCTELSPRPPS